MCGLFLCQYVGKFVLRKEFRNKFIHLFQSVLIVGVSPLFTMPTLKTSNFNKITLGPTRTCPECEEPELEITGEDLNLFECNYCGALWFRVKPTMTENGKMTNLPTKLKKLIKKGKP